MNQYKILNTHVNGYSNAQVTDIEKLSFPFSIFRVQTYSIEHLENELSRFGLNLNDLAEFYKSEQT